MGGSFLPTLATLLGWYDVTRFGAKADNATDCTAAIQDAIDACAASGGGVVYFPPGRYYVAGPVTLPSRDGSASQPPITITIKGAWAPPRLVWGDSRLGTPPSAGLSAIRTDATYSGGNGSIFTAPQNAGPILYGYFSAVAVIVEDLAFETYANPSVGCLDLRHAICANVRRVICTAGGYNSNNQPTHSGSTAIALPSDNNGAFVGIEDTIINGYYTGLLVGEHTVGRGSLSFSACNDALSFPDMNHGCTFERLLVQACFNGLTFTANVPGRNNTRVRVGEYSAERHTSGWYSGGYEVNDPSNYAAGTLSYSMNNFTGDTTAFAKNGGVNLVCTNIGN